MTKRRFPAVLLVSMLACFLPVWAQNISAERAVLARAAVLHISPDASSEKLVTAERGREAVVMEHSHGWAHVVVTLPPVNPEPQVLEEEPEPRTLSGWVLDKGLISASTPNGDQILFGEAVDSENEASRSGGRRGAASDARRLYARVAEYFPNSPLAGESLYRAADVQWQLDQAERRSRPSARARDPRDRVPVPEDEMKKVEKKFAHTKWADLAAWRLLENRLCGDWAAESKCPEKEAEIYEKYAQEHPDSPTAAEALYDVAYRYGALIELYKMEGQSKKSEEAQQKAISAAQRALGKNPPVDWATRAQRLLYMLQKQMPVYGSAVE